MAPWELAFSWQNCEKNSLIIFLHGGKSWTQTPIVLSQRAAVGKWSLLIVNCVTITPYLSRDTTYCYRHCKGISHFPLLLYHSSPRPMPDRIAPTLLTFARITSPYRTHASKPPSRALPHGQPRSLLSLSHFPFDVIMTYGLDPDSNLTLFLWHHRLPIPYDKTIALDPDHTYGHSLLAHSFRMMNISLISDVLYNAMTHLGLRCWQILAHPMTMSLINPYLRWLIPRIVLLGYVICLCLTNISIHYISRSIPSLYGRLDFFQSTTF